MQNITFFKIIMALILGASFIVILDNRMSRPEPKDLISLPSKQIPQPNQLSYDSKIEPADRKIENLETEVANLKKQLQDIRLQIAQAAIQPQPFDDSQRASRDSQNIRVPRALEKELEIQEQNLLAQQQNELIREQEDLDARFLSEPYDSTWADAKVATIHQALQSEALQATSIVAIQCRTTLCRVEVEHDDPSAADDFAMWFAALITDKLDIISIQQNDADNGLNSTIAYLTPQQSEEE